MNNIIQFQVGKNYKGLYKQYTVVSRTKCFVTLDNGKRVKVQISPLGVDREQLIFKTRYSLYGMFLEDEELVDASRLVTE